MSKSFSRGTEERFMENTGSEILLKLNERKHLLYWQVLCVSLTQAGVFTEKGASIEKIPP